MKRAILFAAGVAAGISLVVACQQALGNKGGARSECVVWQYTTESQLNAAKQVTLVNLGGVAAAEVTGWEPYATSPSGAAALRRCKQ